jgi:hypothetical protein
MASTPPPSPPPPETPLTSPQRHQHAGRHQERLERVVGSPEQRRVPAPAPLTFSISAPVAGPSALPVAGPAAPPVAGPSNLTHLPAHLAAGLAALAPYPAPSGCSSSVAPPPQIMSFSQLSAAYAALPPLRPVRSASVSIIFQNLCNLFCINFLENSGCCSCCWPFKLTWPCTSDTNCCPPR